MADQAYHGGCHCGAVQFDVRADTAKAVACNCSICSKAGYVLTFVPSGQFELTSGADQLTDYTFNKHHIHHVFCKTCGIHAFARGANPQGGETVAVNLRCLDGVDVTSLTPKLFDGRSL